MPKPSYGLPSEFQRRLAEHQHVDLTLPFAL